MRRILTLSAVLAFASALAFAETWTGNLIDASCAQHMKNNPCTPTASTASFAILASGKLLKLDAEGNQKAAEAFKQSSNGADREKDPSAAATPVTATVEGTLMGDEIKVDSIQVR